MNNRSSQAIQMHGTYRQVLFPMAQHVKAKGRAIIQVINADNTVDREFEQENLLLNQGLDGIAIRKWCDSFLYCAAGSGTTPTSDSSGGTTVAQTGTVVTLSGGSFTFTDTGTDAGKVIRWAGGSQATILTVTDSHHATVDVNQVVGSGAFTVYRSNQVGLTTEIVRTNNYVTGVGNCGSVNSGSVLTHTRTFLFPNELGNVTYREVGFSWASSAGNNLFSRIRLQADLPLVVGQSLRIVYSLQLTVDPATPNTKAASIVGWPIFPATDTNGSEQFQYIGLSAVNPGSGSTTNFDAGLYVNEPSVSASVAVFISISAAALAVLGSAANRTGTSPSEIPVRLTSYIIGSFTIDKYAVFQTADANGTQWRSVGIGRNDGSLHSYINSGFVFLFDQAQTKDSNHQLELHFTFSWAVDLS